MKYTLNWVVFGNNPYKDNFSVNIGVDTNINLLKKAIREDITAPDSIKAKDLKLFKVDLPLRGNKDENVINICTNNIGDAGVEMSEGLQKHFWQALKNTNHDELSSLFMVSEDVNFFGKPSQPPADLLLNQSSTNLLSNQPSIDLLFDQSYQSSTDLLLNQPLTDLSLDQSQIQVECIIEEEYYTETIVKFASNYIGQQVILKLKKIVIDKCHRDVNAVINGSKSNPVTDCVFEQIAHKILQNGGTFKRRSLDTNEEDSIVFLKHDLVLLTQIDEIQNEAYSILLDKSFPLVDAIIAPNCLLQMTIAKDHNIKISGLKRVQSKLETESNIYFYFVVPTKLYSSYKKQKYSTTGDKNALNMEPWIGKHLKQYVLEIDLACLEYKM
ncbi:7815_t:CDS:2 [Rhizophagus irregularis]|nr:7815_t:CDS:2 [Rhizophagus irregularis]